MRRAVSPLVVFLVAGVSVVAGDRLPAVSAVALAVVTGVAAAAVLELRDRREARDLALRATSWLHAHEPAPEPDRGPVPARRATAAIDALGAAYRDTVEEFGREEPWRRELVGSLVQPALLFDAASRLQSANEAARELLRIPIDAGEVTVVQAVGSPTIADAVHEARRGAGPISIDVEHTGHELRVAVSPVGDEVLVIITDRTRERRIEDLRRNFVVNASHELKTPVTSIQTLAEALAVTVRNDPDRTVTLVTRLGEEAQRLARLLHDLLDLRRLEERGPLERVPVDLAELARRAIAEVIPRADDVEVTVALDAPEHAVVVGVWGDLEVIVKNLVGNALQYNRVGGSITVGIAPQDGMQVLTVTDTGIGIPRQDLQRIFERFYRVDTARSRETGGTGLGLSIVRHAVERHGGSVRVDSLLGEGTTFTVCLPVEPPR